MDLNQLNLNVNRLLTNIWSIVSFLKEYTVNTAKDVSITHTNEVGAQSVKTFPNIAKQIATSQSGSVLQVVSHLTAIQGSQTVTTVDTRVNDLAKTIIPKGNNSKFLVSVRWFGECQNGWDVLFNVRMNGVRVNVNGGGRQHGLTMATATYPKVIDDSSTPELVNTQTLVTTNSIIGTPIEFEVVADTRASVVLWNNRCFTDPSVHSERGTSEIIIAEIGA